MNYIYDIVLNFNKEYYNFFEWNKRDNIVNVKKIPLYVMAITIYVTGDNNICNAVLHFLLSPVPFILIS